MAITESAQKAQIQGTTPPIGNDKDLKLNLDHLSPEK
jgi:hypothetical protein